MNSLRFNKLRLNGPDGIGLRADVFSRDGVWLRRRGRSLDAGGLRSAVRVKRSSRRQASGFSLLEVILSIVILAGCLAVLGELVRVGARSSRSARDLTTAQLLCETMMAEIDAGITPPTANDGVVEHFDGSLWAFTVVSEQVDQEGLLEVIVQVQQEMSAAAQPVSCTLTRWFVDPQLVLDLAAVDQEMAAAQAEQSTAGDSSSGAAEDSSAAGAGGGR